jgi:glutaredoxin
MLTLTLYTRPDCHLCKEMKEVVAEVAKDFPHTLTEIDISGNPEWESRFGLEIPVLFVNGRKAFKYRVTTKGLRNRLKREGHGRRWRTSLLLRGKMLRG